MPYLTVTHGHTALFGTYGMLAIGLLLFAYRGIVQEQAWQNRSGFLKTCFWGTNIGLIIMFLCSLLPVGILQLIASFTKGIWFARSPEFYNGSMVMWFGQIRIIPDTIIIVLGALPLLLFILSTIGRLKKVEVKENQSINTFADTDSLSL